MKEKEQDYPNPERCRICSGREAPSLSAKYLDIKFHNENCLKEKEPTEDIKILDINTDKEMFEHVYPDYKVMEKVELKSILEMIINTADIMLSHSQKSRRYELHNTIEDLIDENMLGMKMRGEIELEKYLAEDKE